MPFLSEALELLVGSLDDENGDRSEAYQICFNMIRHACELHNLDLTGVFASVGRLIQNIDLDIRRPVVQKRYGLREHKDHYVRILLRKLGNYLTL